MDELIFFQGNLNWVNSEKTKNRQRATFGNTALQLLKG